MKQKLALACTLVHEPRGDPARRADDRRRPGVAPRVLEAAVGVPGAGHHDPDVHAVPGRGRALHARRAAARRARARARRARRACARRCRAAVRGHRRPTARRGRPASLRDGIDGVRTCSRSANALHVVARRERRRRRAAAAGRRACRPRDVVPASVRAIAPSLEDVFIARLTGTWTLMTRASIDGGGCGPGVVGASPLLAQPAVDGSTRRPTAVARGLRGQPSRWRKRAPGRRARRPPCRCGRRRGRPTAQLRPPATRAPTTSTSSASRAGRPAEHPLPRRAGQLP